MKRLWQYLDQKQWSAKTKYKAAFFLLAVRYALTGFFAWLIIRQWALSTWDWMICFIGYPVCIAFFVVAVYGGNHCFHNGRADHRL